MDNLWIRIKGLHPSIPPHPSANRPYRLSFATNPRWYCLLRAEKLGKDCTPGRWSFSRLWKILCSWEDNRPSGSSGHLGKMGHMKFWVLSLQANPLFCQLNNWMLRNEVSTWFGYTMLWGWKEKEMWLGLEGLLDFWLSSAENKIWVQKRWRGDGNHAGWKDALDRMQSLALRGALHCWQLWDDVEVPLS